MSSPHQLTRRRGSGEPTRAASIAELKGHTGWVNSAAFSNDGSRVVTTSNDDTARIWQTATGVLITELKGHANVVTSAAFSEDGLRVVTASNDKTARIWRTDASRNDR